MTTDRLEVRLDPEQRRRMDALATDACTSASQLGRDLREQAYAQLELRRRRAAAQMLGALSVGDVPEPEELTTQLDRAYEQPGLR